MAANRIVTGKDLEARLAVLESRVKRPREGLFGPQSMEWRVNGEAAIFLGAGRALLLQLAHPFVAAAVADHSRVFADPLGRFHRTFQLVFTLVFGTLQQAFFAARQLHRRHAVIRGMLPEAIGPFAKGTRYCANDAENLLWVHATLVETALLAHDLLLPPLNEQERETYYAESCLMAALYGIPRDLLPSNWAAFASYSTAMQSNILTVSIAAKNIADMLQKQANYMPAWYWLLSGQLLPPQVRAAFGLEGNEASLRTVDRTVGRLRCWYQVLPSRLRHVGPFQEAQARLLGKSRPGLPTQLFNILWIGRPSLTVQRSEPFWESSG
jgi:uncharacterized protein (DUF2236 family)